MRHCHFRKVNVPIEELPKERGRTATGFQLKNLLPVSRSTRKTGTSPYLIVEKEMNGKADTSPLISVFPLLMTVP